MRITCLLTIHFSSGKTVNFNSAVTIKAGAKKRATPALNIQPSGSYTTTAVFGAGVTLQNDGDIVVAQNAAATFSGVITGTGNKRGSQAANTITSAGSLQMTDAS